MTIQCLRCGKSPTIKAHIFPSSTIRAIRKRGPDTKIKAIYGDRAITTRSPNGIYDAKILCKTCDGRIGVADKWFIENLENFHVAAVERQPFEPVKILLNANSAIQFAVSIIYRASLSCLNHFNDVSLGAYTAAAAAISTGSNGANFDKPFVMINVLTSAQYDVRQFVFYPVKCSGGNGQYYVFTISGVQFLVKFGGRHNGISHNDACLAEYRIRSGGEAIVCCYPFEEAAEAKFLWRVKRRSYSR
jgi:hypothetical protein